MHSIIKLGLVSVVVGALSFAPARAQYHNSINSEAARIQQDAASGLINQNQAQGLEMRDAQIRNQEQQYMMQNGGRLTSQESRQIRSELKDVNNHLNRDVQRDASSIGALQSGYPMMPGGYPNVQAGSLGMQNGYPGMQNGFQNSNSNGFGMHHHHHGMLQNGVNQGNGTNSSYGVIQPNGMNPQYAMNQPYGINSPYGATPQYAMNQQYGSNQQYGVNQGGIGGLLRNAFNH